MSTTDIRMTALEVVNEAERKLGINNVSSSFTSSALSRMLLDFLNDTIDELCDFGDWQQMLREVQVTAVSSIGEYKIAVSADVQRVSEIVFGDDVASMEVRSIEDVRRLQRVNSYGVPRQFALTGVSGTVPKFRISPIVNQAAIDVATSAGGFFDVLYYKRHRLLTTSDTTATPAFPSRILVQGVYEKALLEENGGEQTREWQTARRRYEHMTQEANNRFKADTGGATYFVPTGGKYA